MITPVHRNEPSAEHCMRWMAAHGRHLWSCSLVRDLMLKVLSFHFKVYNPRIRASSLVLQPISQSQAEIRKQVLGSSSSGSYRHTD